MRGEKFEKRKRVREIERYEVNKTLPVKEYELLYIFLSNKVLTNSVFFFLFVELSLIKAEIKSIQCVYFLKIEFKHHFIVFPHIFIHCDT